MKPWMLPLPLALVLASCGASSSALTTNEAGDGSAAAGPEREVASLAGEVGLDDGTGCAVALSGDGTRAILGSRTHDSGAEEDAGSARVFVRSGDTWVEEATLLAADGAGRDYFGSAVALSADGTRAIVGAPEDDVGASHAAGSARVFVRSGTTWTEEAVLVTREAEAFVAFGCSVALTADASLALVGACEDDTASAQNAGTARVFLRVGSTWTEEATLADPDGNVDDRFGVSVALSADGSRALVGEYWRDAGDAQNMGTAHVFARHGTVWVEEATLLAADGAPMDLFGVAVSLDGDGTRALVGASGRDTTSGEDVGRAHVFVRDGRAWNEEATLLAVGGAEYDGFGGAVALSARGDRAVVGAAGEEGVGARSFVRSGTTWTEEARLVPSTPGGDPLGLSVATSADGSYAITGSGQRAVIFGPAR
jgi:hypothetical protein